MNKRIVIPGIHALRESIRGAQDLAINELRDDVRGGTQEFVDGPVVFWNFLFPTIALVAASGAQRILSAGQKPVEFLRFESSPANVDEILIGYEGVAVRANAVTDLLPGQGINFEMETDDYSRNQFIDAASFFAIPRQNSTLFVTLGYRDQRVQQL